MDSLELQTALASRSNEPTSAEVDVDEPRMIGFRDFAGDMLSVRALRNDRLMLRAETERSSVSVHLERHQASVLRDHITDWLCDGTEAVAQVLPDAKADGYEWPVDRGECLPRREKSTIADEAMDLLYGDREDEYGTPRESFTRIAQMWTLLLQDKLQDGEYVTPEDVGRCMLGLKLSRDVNHPKRDGRVDMAGYAIALDRLETGL